MTLLERVIEHEGFRSYPYQDTEGVTTFGHGLTFLTESESRHIVIHRLEQIQKRYDDDVPWFYTLPLPVRDVVYEMTYQLGYSGVAKFSRMWAALKQRDYTGAADEMLDSKWARQTPERALSLSQTMRLG